MSKYGKDFENRFKKDWIKTFPDSIIFRIPDQMSRYKGASENICDFIEFYNGTLFLTEIKTHAGASMPFSALPQYERMLPYVGKKNVRVGIVLWLYEKDGLILYIPISTVAQLKEEGRRSVGLKAYNDGYNIKLIPSKKKRVFYDSDYSFMLDLREGE